MKSLTKSKKSSRSKSRKVKKQGFDIKAVYGTMLALALEEVVTHTEGHNLSKLKKRRAEIGPVVGNSGKRFDLATREGRDGLEAYCVAMGMNALTSGLPTNAEAKKKVVAAGSAARIWQALQAM